MFIPPAPPAIEVRSTDRQAHPFSFAGFSVGMPVSGVASYLKASGGSFACQPAHTPQRECDGKFGLPSIDVTIAIEIKLWSVADTVRQVRLSTDGEPRVAPRWVAALRGDYGEPKHEVEFGKQQSWEWSRAGETLLLIERIVQGSNVSTSVTLGTSPLITTPRSPESKRPPEG